jgi:hypothetical protein
MKAPQRYCTHTLPVFFYTVLWHRTLFTSSQPCQPNCLTNATVSFLMVHKLKLHTSVYSRYAAWVTHLNFFTCINNTITCQAEILPGCYLLRLFRSSWHNHSVDVKILFKCKHTMVYKYINFACINLRTVNCPCRAD